MTSTQDTATHQTVTRYRYSGPEVHGHTSYAAALAFAQQRMAINGVGDVSIEIDRIENGRDRWIETVGGIR